MQYNYSKSKINVCQLQKEISAGIAKCCTSVKFSMPDALTIYFAEALSDNEKNTLDVIVAEHTAQNIFENVVAESVISEILAETTGEQLTRMKAFIRDYTVFYVYLKIENYPDAEGTLDAALSAGVLLQEDHDLIMAKMPNGN